MPTLWPALCIYKKTGAIQFCLTIGPDVALTLWGQAVSFLLFLFFLQGIPQEGPSQPTKWSHLATEARALARR